MVIASSSVAFWKIKHNESIIDYWKYNWSRDLLWYACII